MTDPYYTIFEYEPISELHTVKWFGMLTPAILHINKPGFEIAVIDWLMPTIEFEPDEFITWYRIGRHD